MLYDKNYLFSCSSKRESSPVRLCVLASLHHPRQTTVCTFFCLWEMCRLWGASFTIVWFTVCLSIHWLTNQRRVQAGYFVRKEQDMSIAYIFKELKEHGTRVRSLGKPERCLRSVMDVITGSKLDLLSLMKLLHICINSCCQCLRSMKMDAFVRKLVWIFGLLLSFMRFKRRTNGTLLRMLHHAPQLNCSFKILWKRMVPLCASPV